MYHDLTCSIHLTQWEEGELKRSYILFLANQRQTVMWVYGRGSRKKRGLANLLSVWWYRLHSSYASMGETACFPTSQQGIINWGMECTDVRESYKPASRSFWEVLIILSKLPQEEIVEESDVTHFIFWYQFYERPPVDSCAKINLDKPKMLLLLCIDGMLYMLK